MNNIGRYPNCSMRTEIGNCDLIGGFCTSVNENVCDALHKVSRPKGEWIPCSERLPSKDGFYIATCDGEICGEEQPFAGFAEFENRKWVDDEDDYQCVLAWMPLPEPYKGGDTDCRGWNNTAEDCIRNIKALPSADAEWIKVTEDTPPEYPCLVCDANGNQPFVPMGIVTITDEEHGEWHIDGRLWDSPKVFVDGEWGNQISYGNRIIAWMPLPKPYREESEVEE